MLRRVGGNLYPPIPSEQCHASGTPENFWGLVNETLYKGFLTMHPTSSTTLSDTIARLLKLEKKLQHASFIPQQELVGLLIAGSLIISELAECTTTLQFSTQEIDLISSLTEVIEMELDALHSPDAPDRYDNNEHSQDDLTDGGWEHPEWDN